ncbi:MAG: isocitrate lyase/PEP mutase family protein, partial [Haliea sp.]
KSKVHQTAKMKIHTPLNSDKPMSHAQQLRQLLSGPSLLKAPGIYDGLSGLLVEQAGFGLAFLSGACIAFARYGRPDMGLISAAEVADTISVIRERITIPLLADMDTGFGNALNVQRTVKTFERAGASALQMEDQVMPKRCGHMAGKNVISCSEMVGKIKAALDARENEHTVLIARTDALGVNGFDDAMERAERYAEAGADVLFIEAPKTLEQMQAIGNRFGHRLPLVHNLVEGGHSPVPNADALIALHYKVALFPTALLHQFVPQAQALLQHILTHGNTTQWQHEMYQLSDINGIVGAEALLELGKQYDIPG